MGFYEEVAACPFINATGCMYTRFGGSIMPPPVLAAMAEASKHFVNMFDLQNQVGRKIAEMTHNEAAFVSCGAASGMLLCAAAIMAGADSEKAARLPNTNGLRNEFIMHHCASGTEIDHMILAAGGKIIFVGPQNRPAPPTEILAAINDQTAAIVLLEGTPGTPEIISGARKQNIPVIIDGAAAVPPKKNLWHYTRDLDADAFLTSGGKGLRAPQSTGLVLGKQWIIEACKFHASPNLRIGRGMKVGKEEFAGIYTAVKLLLDSDEQDQITRERQLLTSIADHLKDLPGTRASIINDRSIQIVLDPAVISITTEQIAAALIKGDPSILLSGRDNKITIRANLLQDGEEQIVIACLRQIIVKRNV